LINEGRDFVLIQYYVFDKVLRPLSYFELNWSILYSVLLADLKAFSFLYNFS
jgi:hypothetical protein